MLQWWIFSWPRPTHTFEYVCRHMCMSSFSCMQRQKNTHTWARCMCSLHWPWWCPWWRSMFSQITGGRTTPHSFQCFHITHPVTATCCYYIFSTSVTTLICCARYSLYLASWRQLLLSISSPSRGWLLTSLWLAFKQYIPSKVAQVWNKTVCFVWLRNWVSVKTL